MTRARSFAVLLVLVGGAVAARTAPALMAPADTAAKSAPVFEVDPFWPKPLPNNWVIGSTIGVSVDAQDHVWIIHRPPSVPDELKAADLKIGACCHVAPPVLEFDQAGNLVGSWGGPG